MDLNSTCSLYLQNNARDESPPTLWASVSKECSLMFRMSCVALETSITPSLKLKTWHQLTGPNYFHIYSFRHNQNCRASPLRLLCRPEVVTFEITTLIFCGHQPLESPVWLGGSTDKSLMVS